MIFTPCVSKYSIWFVISKKCPFLFESFFSALKNFEILIFFLNVPKKLEMVKEYEQSEDCL